MSNLLPGDPAKLAELLPDTWFAFEGSDVRIKALDERVVPEPDRHGERGENCGACARPDSDYLWTNEHWRVRPYLPTPIAGIVLLESRAHHDSYSDLTPDLLAEVGPMTKKIEDAVLAMGDVGRVHMVRWGDGGEHFHFWFMPRPLGALQLRGSMLPVWMDVLADLPDEEARAALAKIASALDSSA